MNTKAKLIRLTRKDIEALELASRGMTTGEIATHLKQKSQTVNSRVTRALVKLGARNRAHAIGLVMASGLIEGPDPVNAVAANERTRAEFAMDYKALRARGLTHAQIAQAMGIKRKTFDRRLMVVRRVGLLPPFRAAVMSS